LASLHFFLLQLELAATPKALDENKPPNATAATAVPIRM
jgi:hypothetical protein